MPDVFDPRNQQANHSELSDKQLGDLYRPLPSRGSSPLLTLEGRRVIYCITFVVALLLLYGLFR